MMNTRSRNFTDLIASVKAEKRSDPEVCDANEADQGTNAGTTNKIILWKTFM